MVDVGSFVPVGGAAGFVAVIGYLLKWVRDERADTRKAQEAARLFEVELRRQSAEVERALRGQLESEERQRAQVERQLDGERESRRRAQDEAARALGRITALEAKIDLQTTAIAHLETEVARLKQRTAQ